MIERLYGKEVTHTKYDLMYSVKSFMGTYSELFLFNHLDTLELDLNLLAQSLVEKTNLLAKHASIPFITKDIFNVSSQMINEKVTQRQLLELLEEKINEVEEAIDKESLIHLKQHVINPTLSRAIIKGLLENIKNNAHCKWISYLLRDYFQL